MKTRARSTSPPCTVDPGSFRDRQGRVYVVGDSVLHGLSVKGLDSWKAQENTACCRRFMDEGKLVATRLLEPDVIPAPLLAEGWAAVLEHQEIPFISYPSEWCFGMLRDAALLHLELMEAALAEDVILQDATPFNV